MGRYFPPDFDWRKTKTLNAVTGKHALGNRARKIGEGILITRFELPFNIWCGEREGDGCGKPIGQGVRLCVGHRGPRRTELRGPQQRREEARGQLLLDADL